MLGTFIRATFDQHDTDDDGVDYGIVNVYYDDKHYFDVADCEDFNIVEQVEYLTGLANARMTQLPFNPHGDGFDYQGYAENKL